MMIQVILTDDHSIVRNGIKMLLEETDDISVIGEAADGEEALELLKTTTPDILIADIRMPVMNGLELTREVKKKYPQVRILVLTMHDDSEYILQALQYGADGYLLKDTGKPEFIKAIHVIMEGQKYFSGDISNTIVNSYLNMASGNASPADNNSRHASDYQLTKRETQILKMIRDGMNNKEIAEKLDKSIRTIETHRFNIMKKLDVNNIAELLKKVESEHLV